MILNVLVICGFLFTLSNGAAIISLPALLFNKTLDYGVARDFGEKNNENSNEECLVKLSPGAKIYFYTTENENLLIGPKLESDDEVTISVINQDETFRKHISPFDAEYAKEKSFVYTVLKNGILVPQKNKREFESDFHVNKCVYQSPKRIYYVKSFKKILIPANILYSQSMQNELFNNDNLENFNLSVTDSPEINLMDKNTIDILPEEEIFAEHPESNESTPTITSHWEEPLLGSTFRREKSSFEAVRDDSDPEDGEDDDDIIYPDKTCNGEVTLFVLNGSGVLKRIKADPYLPTGLHLSFSLTDDFTFVPKFTGKSDLVMSYITGENGDLIPHSDNSHKVTAEFGRSVSFMLSKNGGLFPVKEEKSGKMICYYFNGNLIHESNQFSEVHSNSTSIAINNKKYQLFLDDKDKEKEDPLALNENFKKLEKTENSKKKKHRLRKRDVYYNNYDKGGNMQMQSSMEPHTIIRPIPNQNRMSEFQVSGMRNPAYVPGRQQTVIQEPPVSNVASVDSRYSDSVENFQRPPKMIPSQFEMNSKPVPNMHNPVYSEPEEGMERQREEGTSEVASPSSWDNSFIRTRTDIFIFDDKGTRIRLIPEITENNDVVIYKLTCKGNLVRYPPCKEPEFGFEINFQLLLDEFVLVPTVPDHINGKTFYLTYILQENGDLIPSESNTNTYKKAPGSLIYYMLGKNNILFPVQQVVDTEGNVSFFYQDYFLLKMKDSVDKPLHFSTKGAPLFAFFNGLSVISMSSKPRLGSRSGSNWKHLKPTESTETLQKSMYLTGPKGELIKIAPYKNRQGATVVYELDCNGILYRSPKDKKKCIILKSYILLKEGILLPSNDTNGYVYMMSKNGDLFPYLYPDGKIEAPLASSLKYVLCEKGILLPIKLEIIDNSICYLFRDVVVYKERVYYKSCLDRLDNQLLDSLRGSKRGSCDLSLNEPLNSTERDLKLFVNKNGDNVFYEKQNKLLKRHPSESVPSYLRYTMGSFEVKPDGSLYQIQYQDPNTNVVNLMLEPNGDLLEDTRNVNNVRSDYYVLDSRGNLISVDARKTKRNWYFYKGSTRVCKVPMPVEEEVKVEAVKAEETVTPLGKDPLRLMEDPSPSTDNANVDTRSLYIPIPLKSVTVSNPETCVECKDPEHKKKCDMLQDTLKQVSKGNSLPLALELELTDDIIEELKNWAAKCDKVLSRRDVNGHLLSYLNRFNGMYSENEQL